MTYAIISSASGIRPLRWLVIPAAIALIVLTGLATSTESSDEFIDSDTAAQEERSQSSSGGPIDDSNDGQPLDGTLDPAPNEPDQDLLGPASIEIVADDGRIDIDLGGRDPIAHPGQENGQRGDAVTLDDQARDDGGAAGLRLTDDGELEPVEQDEIRPGDAVIAPADGGVDVVAADGGRIEIRTRPGVAGAPIAATAVGQDGSREDVEPGDDGTIDAGDGVTIQLPAQAEEPADDTTFWDRVTSWRWLLIGLLVLAGLGLACFAYLRRRQEEQPFGPNFVGPGGIPLERFDEFLAMLAADADTARAVRLAFHAAEAGMGVLPRRYSTETPFEWHDRVARVHRDLAEPLRSLCDRFASARFAPEPPSSTERDQAIEELSELNRLARGPSITIGTIGQRGQRATVGQ